VVATTIPLTASRLAALWALLYALYRGYYAAGGTIGKLGTPVSEAAWLRINLLAALLLLGAAVLPLVIPRVWHPAGASLAFLCFGWIVTVGCVMHALIGITQRILSLTGHLVIDYPFWLTIDRRRADLQALSFNEPWFLIEGVLWAAIVWTGGMRTSPRRGWWMASIILAITVLTTMGVLSATGVIGRWVAW
jgi:hypothetical protein